MSQAMTREECKARIALDCDATTFPVLSDEDIEALAKQCQRADASGLGIDEDDYTETYDPIEGIISGFYLKASRVVTAHDIQGGIQKLNRSQMREGFLGLAKEYKKRRGLGSVQIGGAS